MRFKKRDIHKLNKNTKSIQMFKESRTQICSINTLFSEQVIPPVKFHKKSIVNIKELSKLLRVRLLKSLMVIL